MFPLVPPLAWEVELEDGDSNERLLQVVSLFPLSGRQGGERESGTGQKYAKQQPRRDGRASSSVHVVVRYSVRRDPGVCLVFGLKWPKFQYMEFDSPS